MLRKRGEDNYAENYCLFRNIGDYILALLQIYQRNVFDIVLDVYKAAVCNFFSNPGCGVLYHDIVDTDRKGVL